MQVSEFHGWFQGRNAFRALRNGFGVVTPKGYLVATVTGLVMAFVYLAQCWWWQFGKCWCCKGSGRHYKDEKRKVFRDCRWCRGSGKRLRIGRRIYNKFEMARRRAR